jgi:hypothetical protein
MIIHIYIYINKEYSWCILASVPQGSCKKDHRSHYSTAHQRRRRRRRRSSSSSRAAKIMMLRLKTYYRKVQQQGQRKPDPVRTHLTDTGPPRNSSCKRAPVKCNFLRYSHCQPV